MQQQRLGSADFTISPIGLGTWAIAGPGWEFGWGAQDDAQSLAALEYAVERGVNWIDTAAAYGLGHAEEIVGQLLRRVPASRRPLVFTKGSLVWDHESRKISHCLAPDSLARRSTPACAASRSSASTCTRSTGRPSRPTARTKASRLRSRCWTGRASRKIRAIGVSNFGVAQLRRAQAVTEIASLQPPYSALMREVEADILPFCEQAGIGVIAYSTLQSGLLTGAMTRERIASLPDDDWRKTRSPDFQEPRLSANLALVEGLRRVGERHGLTPAAVAIVMGAAASCGDWRHCWRAPARAGRWAAGCGAIAVECGGTGGDRAIAA